MSDTPNPKQFMLKTKDGKDFEVPEDGSLGILALGYKGVMMWREKRASVKAAQKASGNSEAKTDDSPSK